MVLPWVQHPGSQSKCCVSSLLSLSQNFSFLLLPSCCMDPNPQIITRVKNTSRHLLQNPFFASYSHENRTWIKNGSEKEIQEADREEEGNRMMLSPLFPLIRFVSTSSSFFFLFSFSLRRYFIPSTHTIPSHIYMCHDHTNIWCIKIPIENHQLWLAQNVCTFIHSALKKE